MKKQFYISNRIWKTVFLLIIVIAIILLSSRVQKSNVEKGAGEEKFDLFESFEKIKKIEENCYLLEYPDFKMYVFRNSCTDASGKYKFEFNGITFLFDEEFVYGILKEIASHDPVGLEKFVNNLEKIGNYILLLESDDGIRWRETDIVPARDCSVPDLVVGYDGKLHLYYVSFPINKIDSVTSEDGVNWKRKRRTSSFGLCVSTRRFPMRPIRGTLRTWRSAASWPRRWRTPGPFAPSTS